MTTMQHNSLLFKIISMFIVECLYRLQ